MTCGLVKLLRSNLISDSVKRSNPTNDNVVSSTVPPAAAADNVTGTESQMCRVAPAVTERVLVPCGMVADEVTVPPQRSVTVTVYVPGPAINALPGYPLDH